MLILENISFRLPGRALLQEINLHLRRGSLTAITGPNGGGKTTLAKIISGIAQPAQGRLFFDGQDITRLGVTRRAKLGICHTFQQPVRFRGISVRDLLLLAAGEGASEEKLIEPLEQVGLCPKDYLNREVDGSLSGGEIKRIEIAGALARGAQLTIFDEPEAGIDLWSFQNLVQIFQALRSQGKTLLILSHQERILSIADEIFLAKDGHLLPCGPEGALCPNHPGGFYE
ncbi:ATP-binding cassette domain-containing protein [Christensenellaceae bacterium 44-20]